MRVKRLGQFILLIAAAIIVVLVIPALAGVVVKDGPPGGSRIIMQDLNFATWDWNVVTAPDVGALGGFFKPTTRDFDATADEDIGHIVKVPQGYLNSHNPTWTVIWNSAAAVAGAACWCMATAQIASADLIDPAAADNTDCVDTETAGSAGDRNITEITAGGSDMIAGDYLAIQLSRDIDGGNCAGDDDLAGDAVVAGVYLTYRAHH